MCLSFSSTTTIPDTPHPKIRHPAVPITLVLEVRYFFAEVLSRVSLTYRVQTMSQIPPLPQEVVEKIIDCVALQSNKSDRTLWSCALASRAFRIRSQFHIHGSVFIPNLLDESCIFRHYRGSQLASYVRKLTIAGGPYDGDGFFKSRWIPFLDLFPMLKVVHLNNVRHRLPPSPGYQPPLYPSVTSLVLGQIYVPTCQTILSILATMPNLARLSLVQSSCQWRCEGASLITLPVIRELEISCTEGVEELACLISHLDFSDAMKVELHWYADKELRQVKMDSSPILDLVRAATSLREVYFGIRFFPPFREFQPVSIVELKGSLEWQWTDIFT